MGHRQVKHNNQIYFEELQCYTLFEFSELSFYNSQFYIILVFDGK